ncbi:MAG: ATP-binding cassette domain-containing protein [Ignavibacteria bacterium]
MEKNDKLKNEKLKDDKVKDDKLKDDKVKDDKLKDEKLKDDKVKDDKVKDDKVKDDKVKDDKLKDDKSKVDDDKDDDEKEGDKKSEKEIESEKKEKDLNAQADTIAEIERKTKSESSDDGDEDNDKGNNIDESKDNGPILQLTDLKKSFGSNTVLTDINLSVKKGETVVILGRSGTGKSVILKCIIGLILPDEGNIEVFGQEFLNLPEAKENALRVKVGFLFQSGALYDSMTVKQNLEFPIIRQLDYKKEDLTPKVMEALENVGLAKAIDKMPSELSGGMQKRIGLARTLMLDPQIILYDEPTTGLDPVTSNEISHLILDMQTKYKVTSLIVTHDMACAKLVANRIVVLKDGTFAAEGSYDELEKSDDEFVRGFFEFE